MPPRVVYTATKLGMSLRPIVQSLCDWGKRHAEELDAIATRGVRKGEGETASASRRRSARSQQRIL